MHWYAIASLTPAALILAACLLGGPWAWGALISVTGLVMLADRLGQVDVPIREDSRAQGFARRLAVVLAVTHFILLAAGVRAIAMSPALTGAQAMALAVALGLFIGQVSNSNAHELIHATTRRRRMLGVLVYVSLLFGHHASAHPKVHHVHVATARDPNSARLGEGFYHFWPRAWVGSFRAGLRAETDAREKGRGRRALHPYFGYVAGAALVLALAWGLAGWHGVGVHVALAAYAQMQLLLADYVQHYGLRREVMDDGRVEPASARHSWNSDQWYSTAMMLNAPRHSDHHLHPLRQFPALRLDRRIMPVLPYSLPAMAAIAMFPPLWRRLMDPRVTDWRAIHATGGARGGDLALSPHAIGLDDSPLPDDAAGNGADVPDGGRL